MNLVAVSDFAFQVWNAYFLLFLQQSRSRRGKIMASTITRGATNAHKGSSTSSIQGCCWSNGWLRSSSGGGDRSGHNSSSFLPCFLIYPSHFIAPIGTLHVSYNVLVAKSKILNCCSSQMIPHAINPVWGKEDVARSPALLPYAHRLCGKHCPSLYL